jgi:hypothetical protein
MATPDPVPAGEGTTTTLAALQQRAQPPEMNLPEVSAGFTSLRSFELLQRAGKALSQSSLVPTIYQGNLSNCIIALEMAQRIGASPLMVMQNLYIVHNRPAWSAKFLIACFNQCGRFTAVRYLWSGTKGKDDWGCQAWSIEKSTGEKILGPVITMALVKAEGWLARSGSKWPTIPEKMFMYRAAAWMIDTHAPELSMGIRTDDEMGDTYETERAADGQYRVTAESLRRADSVNSPHYDKQGAIDELREAGSAADLDIAWKAITKSYRDRDLQLPPEIEPLYNDRVESLQQKQDNL